MSSDSTFFTIRYSPLCNLPIVGQILLCIQIPFCALHLTNTALLSERERLLSRKLVSLINTRNLPVRCTSWNFGHVLVRFSVPIFFETELADPIDISTTQTYQNTLWTMLSCVSFSDKDRRQLKQFFGKDPLEWKNQKLTK